MNEKIRHLREKLKALNLDGMIVSNPVSIKYLCNIEVDGLLLITRKENIFLTYSMYLEMVKATVTITDEVIVADFRDIGKDEYENFFLFCENVGKSCVRGKGVIYPYSSYRCRGNRGVAEMHEWFIKMWYF